jgi:streptogramin lyase
VRALALAVLAVAGSQPQVVARAETGAAPGRRTAAFGAVWIANDQAGTIARIDPAHEPRHAADPSPRDLLAGARLRGDSPGLRSDLGDDVGGFGWMWVTRYAGDDVWRFAP